MKTQEKNLVTIGNLREVKTGVLVKIYNNFVTKKVKKFVDRKTTEQRTLAAIHNAQKERKEWLRLFKILDKEHQALFTIAHSEKYERVTKKEMAVIYSIYQLSSGDSGKTTTLDKLADYMDANDYVLGQIVARLKDKKIAFKRAGEKVGLLDDAFDYAACNCSRDFLPSEVDMKEPNWYRPGPNSDFTGKTIHRLVSENPRREGTIGWRSWRLIEDGMTYEKYRSKGGRSKDLRWDLVRKYVEVR